MRIAKCPDEREICLEVDCFANGGYCYRNKDNRSNNKRREGKLAEGTVIRIVPARRFFAITSAGVMFVMPVMSMAYSGH